MAKGNTNFQKLRREYIFPVIEQKLAQLKADHPAVEIINLGVGDIALPLAPSISAAICDAVKEMSEKKIYGYGPAEGYGFLRKAIASSDYSTLGITWDEVFISEGINSDITGITDLFHLNSTVAIPDPSYPVYLDANILAGRKNKIVLLPCTQETGFLPVPPDVHCDIVYLCSPSNPTGVAMTYKELARFVEYAKKENALLLYDNAYAAFITSPDKPRSIFEVEGAKDVAIEFRSFSKSAGFTGLRCGYTVIPKTVYADYGKKKISLNSLWQKRQNIMCNGISYPIQKGAEACYTPLGQKETRDQVQSYLAPAKILREGLEQMGHTVHGGVDAPYIWWQTPSSLPSWDFFDMLLKQCHLIAIPGKGFGEHGEGYIRLSTFTTQSKAQTALERIKNLTI